MKHTTTLWRVELANKSDVVYLNPKVEVSLPPELEFLESEDFEVGVGSAGENVLIWSLATIYPGDELVGWFSAMNVATDRSPGRRGEIDVMAKLVGPGILEPVEVHATVRSLSTDPDSTPVRPDQATVLNSANGRVVLQLPAGAVNRPVHVEHVCVDANNEPGIYLFYVNIWDEAIGRPSHRFERPATVRVQFSGMGDSPIHELMAYDPQWGGWQPVETWWESSTGAVRANVHQSGLYRMRVRRPRAGEAGRSPEAIEETSPGFQWMPTTRGVASDLWTGNLTLGYPIEMPVGMRDLVSLSLSYSSEVVNGLRATLNEEPRTHSVQASQYGFGWDIAGLGQITSEIPAPGEPNDKSRAILSFAGGTYELVQDTGGSYEWTTKPESFLRIYHKWDAGDNFPHANRYPWYVWTADGTRYLFGDPGSNWQSGTVYWYRHANRVSRQAKLTRILDTHGNQIHIHWAQETGDVPDNCGQGTDRIYVRSAFPQTVEYFPAPSSDLVQRIQLIWVADRTDTILETNECAQPMRTNKRIKQIQVRIRDNNVTPLPGDPIGFSHSRYYQLVHSYHEASSNPSVARHLKLDEFRPLGASYGILAYNRHSYQAQGGSDYINYLLLTKVDNDYGGVVEIGYENANANVLNCNGVFGRTVVTDLTYWALGEGAGATIAGSKVFSRNNYWGWVYPNNSCDINFEYLGAGWAQEETFDENGSLLRRSTNNYLQTLNGQPHPGRGRIAQSQTFDDSYGALLKIVYGYSVVGEWARLDSETHTRYNLDGSANGVQRRVTYEYQTDHQGDVQYGNRTHVREYETNTLLRTTERWYQPANSGDNPWNIVHITGQPAREILWSADVGQSCLSESKFYYDNASSWTTPPTTGLLTTNLRAENSCGAGWVTTDFTYNNAGRLLTRTDPMGHTWSNGYSDDFYDLFLDWTSNPKGHTVEIDWDYILEYPIVVTGSNGEVTSYEYDQFGRLLHVWRAPDSQGSHEPTEKFNYSYYPAPLDAYRVTHSVRGGNDLGGSQQANYIRTSTYYDGLGRAIQTAEQGRNSYQPMVTSTAYDMLDRSVRQGTAVWGVNTIYVYQPPNWSTVPHTTLTYDGLDRARSQTLPGGSQVLTTYVAWSSCVRSERGAVQRQIIDTLGRVTQVDDFDGFFSGANCPVTASASTTYEFDMADNLRFVRQPGNVVADGEIVFEMRYDLVGQKIWMDDPDMGRWDYRYDASGNVVKQRDARNKGVCFYYDSLNRVKGKTFHDNVTDIDALTCSGSYDVSYTYDVGNNGIGRLYSVFDASGSQQFGYDVRGRTTLARRDINGSGVFDLGYTYNDANQVRTIGYPDGEVVTHNHHNDGLLQRVLGDSQYVTEIQYNSRRQPVCYRYDSYSPIMQTRLTYRDWSDLRLHGITTGLPGATACEAPTGTALQHIEYGYDAAGNVATITDYHNSSQVQSFSYDELDRLTSASTDQSGGGVYGESYEYYDNGNLKRKGPAAAGTYSYGNPAHRHAVTALSGGDSFSYDANGNMLTRHVGGVLYTLTWDHENRLTGASWPGGSATFVYDHNGERVKATVNGETTIYVGPYYERTGNASTKYYYADGRRVALRRTGYAADNGLFYLFSDQIGSTTVVANPAGTLHSEMLYKAWGETRYETTPSVPTDFRFTGQREVAELGLYYYGARYYDPYLNRWIQPDTIVPDPGDPQALNRYSYVRNNPVKYTDPTGHAYDAGGAAGPSCTDGSASYMACTYPDTHRLAGYWIGTTQAEADAGWDKFMAGVETVVGIAFEPADWAITGNHWLHGDFHVLDLAGLLPLVPASGVRALRHADELVELTENTILKRAFRTEQDRFLRKGEQGLSVHIGATDEQISEHLRGDIMTTTYGDVLDLGLNVDKTPGTIRELEPFHFEIVPGLSQTWNQFKNAIKNVPWRKQ